MIAHAHGIGLAAAIFSICACTVAPAGAVTSSSFTYSPARTGYLTIAAMDMAADSATAANDYTINWSSGELRTDALASNCFNTGIHLPAGAKITALSVAYKGTPIIQLPTNILSTGSGSNILMQALTPSAGRTMQTLAISPAVTVSSSKTYGLGVCMIKGDSFFGARITYTYTSAGD